MSGKVKRYWISCMAILGCWCSSYTFAQNHLYSSEQFGIEGAMLGGAVTSGANDVSMGYYNPAAIHMVASQLNISFIQPTYKTYGFEQFWGNNGSSELNTDLGLKSSLISFKTKVKNLNLAFLRIRKSELEDVFSSKLEMQQGDQLSTRYFNYEYSGRDSWYGVGSNLKVGSKLYFGLSQFVSISRFTYSNEILSKETSFDTSEPPIEYFNSEFEGNYRNTGFITKLGLLFDSERHDVGLTLTTPLYLRLRKNGDLLTNTINTVNGLTTVDQIIEEDISPVIKTPWEVNLGYSFEWNPKRKLWFNASYHSAISEYEMVSVVSQGEEVRWMNGNEAVFNFSVGYSHYVSDKLQLSGAIRTNNFAYENKSIETGALRNVILDGNHLHYVLGSKLKFHKSTILLAIDYGRMSDVPNQENFDRISNIDRLSPDFSNLKKNSISILLTYGFIIEEIKKIK